MTFLDMTNSETRRRVQLLGLKGRLKIQIETPLTFRISNLTIARQMGYDGPRSLKKCLAWVERELGE